MARDVRREVERLRGAAGSVTFLILIEPHVSIAPLAKSFSTALSACDVRVFEMKVEKHGSA